MTDVQPTAAESDGRNDGEANRLPFRRLTRGALTLILSTTILFIGVAAFFGLSSLKKAPAARKPEPKVYNVDALKIERRDVPYIIAAHGTAAAERETLISAKVAGQVVLVRPAPPLRLLGFPLGSKSTAKARGSLPLLKVGQPVSPDGPLILQIDPTMYELKVQQADLKVQADDREIALLKQQQANNQTLVQQAQQDLKTYEEEYKLYAEAVARGATVRTQLIQAKLELQRFQTQLTRAKNEQLLFPLQLQQAMNRRSQHQKELEQAKTELAYSRVAAEFKGIISEVHVQPGEFVKLDDPLVRITDNSVVEIPMALAPDDYAAVAEMARMAKSEEEFPLVRLSEGQDVPYQWEGRVTRLAPKADPITRTAKVYVRVDNRKLHRSSQRLLPGMHYFGRIAARPVTSVIAIPREAIVWNDDGREDGSKPDDGPPQKVGKIFVATGLKKDSWERGGQTIPVWTGVAEERRVVVRRTLGSLAIVDGGLKEGERLILTNLDVLHKGARLRFPVESQ